MKRYIYPSLLFMSLALYLASCSPGLHRDIPRGERNRRAEPVREQVMVTAPEEQTLANGSETNEPVVRENEAPASVAAANTTEIDLTAITDRPVESTTYTRELPISTAEGGDTLVITEEQLDEALRSEKTAKTAQVFSIISVVGLLFFPLLLVGLIGTLICVSKVNSYDYVTEEALRRKKIAVIVATVTSILLLLAILALVVLLIVFL